MEYYNTMHSLASNRMDMPFDNSGVEHAVAVMSAIFKYSKDSVDVYASTFDGTISNYEEYYEEFKTALSRNIKIRVLVDKDPLSNGRPTSLVVDLLRQKSTPQIELRKALDDFKEVVKSVTVQEEEIHFALGDDCMVRVENNSLTHKAPYCNFDDKATVAVLKKVFNDAFDKATPISLT